MTTAQTWLVIGGLIQVWASVLIAYAVYWVRIDDGKKRTASGTTAHKISLWNGFFLFSLSVAIPHTGFTDSVNNMLAIAEFVIMILSTGRAVAIWFQGYGNIFKRDSPFIMRSVGIGHMVDLLVVAGILYGVARTIFVG